MAPKTTSIATPTAHLVGPGKIKVVNGRLAFSTGKDSPVRLDPARLTSVLCYGRVGVTDDALRLLFQHGVEVSWLSAAGYRCRGRLVGSSESTTALRIIQHQVVARPAACLELARDAVLRKIDSQLEAARHYHRHGHRNGAPMMRRLLERRKQGERCGQLDELRGVEGAASTSWFEVLREVLVEPWRFERRVRRPPTDPVNALLSLGYTLLTNRTIARCQAAGLEVNLGALHDYRPGRPSLACDLVEPLRVPVDRWVVDLCNQGRVSPADFVSQDGGVRLKPERFTVVIGWWEQRWLKQRLAKRVAESVDGYIAHIRRLAGSCCPATLSGSSAGPHGGGPPAR